VVTLLYLFEWKRASEFTAGNAKWGEIELVKDRGGRKTKDTLSSFPNHLVKEENIVSPQ
jgi:hypothetical protein